MVQSSLSVIFFSLRELSRFEHRKPGRQVAGTPRRAASPLHRTAIPAFSVRCFSYQTVRTDKNILRPARWYDCERQTSLSESGQSKALIVLDAETWQEQKEIPLDIGRRFFRVKGEDQPLPEIGEVRQIAWHICVSNCAWITMTGELDLICSWLM